MADRCYLQKRILNRSKVHTLTTNALVYIRSSSNRTTQRTVGLTTESGIWNVQGPAVWSLRAQTDKLEYARLMRSLLESTPNLAIREAMAVDLDLDSNGEVRGVKTFFGITFRCRATVITTGTFMNGRIWIGKQSMPAGRWTSDPSQASPTDKTKTQL